jgi:hypothetical protein
VDRVAASAALQKSNRLRELFLFLCERALAEPSQVIHEQEIGVKIFGRAPDYDTNLDNLVRVQVSQLRKKLQQYFAGEGQHEPVTIEIPKGFYMPVFGARVLEFPKEVGPDARRLEALARPAGLVRGNWLTAVLAVVASVAVATSLWLVLGRAPFNRDSRPTVHRLWRQMFANGLPSCVVLSDANLVIFEDMIGRQLELGEYRNRGFAGLAAELLPDPQQAKLARNLLSRPFTHLADAHLAGLLEVLNAAHGIQTRTVLARFFGETYLESQNVILLGTRRSNPWLELFEPRLNFRSGFRDTTPPLAWFRNQSPQPGEHPTYAGDWGKRGYCRVAFLPNLNRSGTVLLVSGTDMASTEAGGQFITSERWVKTLPSLLGLKDRARFPYFEILLRVDFLVSTTLNFEVAAHRRI